jgi:hypothetical protein
MSDARSSALARALALSQQVLSAAEQSNLEAVAQLDAERLRLLKSVRAERDALSAADNRMLKEVADLNDRALGLMEHHRRIKARAIDLAAVGRRAVAAYSVTGPQR